MRGSAQTLQKKLCAASVSARCVMISISSSLEDYLEAIFILQQSCRGTRLTDIAEFLGVSKPSVSRAISTLKDAGLLEHESYGTISLTKSGEEYAAMVLHRHKLIKRFLTETLGVDEVIAERDACRMEHVISPQTIQKLFDYLGKAE
jgi:DtxR family Mn-dependent transcriptional regulator